MTRPTPVLLLALLVSVSGSLARAETYDYTVDRFEADGNIHGALDGTPDLVEDFADGVMGPLFGPAAGTVAESGGALHMSSPGVFVGIPGLIARFETSAVISSGFTGIQVGGGDSVMRITLPPQTIGGNDAVNFLISSAEGSSLYYAGVSIVNFNSDLAERNSPPVTPGLSILSHQEAIDYPTGFEQLIGENAAITAASITGDVVLELRYDDTTQTLTTAYSLDGGATFAAPFSPLPLETSSGTASVYVAAVAYEGECPADLDVHSLRLRGLGRPGYSGLNMRLKIGGEQLGYAPLRIVVTDAGAGDATVVDLQLPDTLVATPKCGPRDGWFGGNGYKYKNYSDAMPPSCAAASAQGLRLAQFRWTGTNDVKVKLAKGSLSQVTGPLRVAVYRGTGPVNECDGHVGTATCIVASGKAKCASGL